MSKFTLFIDINKAVPPLIYSSGGGECLEIIYKNAWTDLRSLKYFCEVDFGRPLPIHKLRYARNQGKIQFVTIPRWNSSRGGERYLYNLESVYNWLCEEKFFGGFPGDKSIHYSPEYFLAKAFIKGMPRKDPDFSKGVEYAS